MLMIWVRERMVGKILRHRFAFIRILSFSNCCCSWFTVFCVALYICFLVGSCVPFWNCTQILVVTTVVMWLRMTKKNRNKGLISKVMRAQNAAFSSSAENERKFLLHIQQIPFKTLSV